MASDRKLVEGFVRLLHSGDLGPLSYEEIHKKARAFARINGVPNVDDLVDKIVRAPKGGSEKPSTEPPQKSTQPAKQSTELQQKSAEPAHKSTERAIEESPSGLPLIVGSTQWLKSLSQEAREGLREKWLWIVNARFRFRYFISPSELKGTSARVEWNSVDPRGEIALTVFAKTRHGFSGHGNVRVVLRETQPLIECKCREGSDCLHRRIAVSHLWDELQSETSPLTQTLLGTDDPQYGIEVAVSLLAKMKKHVSVPGEIDLEKEPDADEEVRYAWNFCVRGSDFVVHPVKQQLTKKGVWNKGREIRIETFYSLPASSLSPIEKSIQERLEESGSSILHAVDVLRLVANTDLAMLDFRPCQIRFHKLEVWILESPTKQSYKFSTNVAQLQKQRSAEQSGVDEQVCVMGGSEFAVLLDFKNAEIHLYDFDERCDSFVRHILTRDVEFDASRKKEILKSIQEVQHLLPVVLPESLNVPVINAAVDPVLLLEMRRTGVLEAKLCTRDEQGKLFLPGEGVLRRFDKEDGKTIQRVRDCEEEQRRLQQIQAQLPLHGFSSVSPWTWRADTPELVTSLLCESAGLVTRGELSVLWHKHSADRFEILGRVSAKNVQVKVNRQRDWFGVQGSCQIGDQVVPLQTLLAGMNGQRRAGLVEITPGKWVAIAEELRKTLQRLSDVSFETRGKLQLDATGAMAVSALEAQEVQVESDREWKRCLERLKSADEINAELPPGLNCTLRDYQLAGFRWLCRLSTWGVGGILADDMGLGKTVQALALLLHRVESGPALVIAPTSLGFNWKAECERFAPSLTPILFREADRGELLASASTGQVIICSYGLALREADQLKKVEWGTIIFDEAQNIKNSNSKTAQQVKLFPARWKIALTGTPMENHLGELWSIFHVVAPGVLGPWEQFRKRFAQHIERGGNPERQAALSSVIAPFILRRNKEDVLRDLPELSESNLIVDLTPDERQRYDEMRLAAVSEVDSLAADGGELSHDSRFRVLQILTRLRQMACHIGLVDPAWTGSSSKLDVLMERLEQLKERGHRVLVFSQFTSHLELIRKACEERAIQYQYLDGQTPPAQRQKRVEEFQAGKGDVFLISLKAGGSGLNLTAADYVIHMDPWWNPAVEDQATDRAHRIGQTKNVMVYRIIARGTVEEQILSLHEEKRGLVEGVLSGTESSAAMSTAELANLIRAGVGSG